MKQETDKRNGVWVTPMSFFEPLRDEFDLQIDAAAQADNALLPVFFCPGARDAFTQDWTGKRIWCNPPYNRAVIYRWVKKIATGGAAVVVALLPARTDTRWFHDFIYKKRGVQIRFVKGRIKFSGMKGLGKFPSMVVIFKSKTPRNT